MSEHKAKIIWKKDSDDFSYQSYTRDHTWSFPNGLSIDASAAPDYLGNENLVDPEEAFVASVASCHMLTFLAIAARKRYVVDEYCDDAVGVLAKDSDNQMAITKITLSPKIVFSGEKIPSAEEMAALHNAAHKHCFIANSIKTEVVVNY